MPLSRRMPSTVARILKVNHGGEHGAVQIYAAQIAAARLRCPDLVPELADLLAHERRHKQMFLALMPSRAARPCRLMPLWALGGFALTPVSFSRTARPARPTCPAPAARRGG